MIDENKLKELKQFAIDGKKRGLKCLDTAISHNDREQMMFHDGAVSACKDFIHKINYFIDKEQSTVESSELRQVLKHPNDDRKLSEYVRLRRTDRLDEWSMDALANDIESLENQLNTRPVSKDTVSDWELALRNMAGAGNYINLCMPVDELIAICKNPTK